jgi:hypothetical protein
MTILASECGHIVVPTVTEMPLDTVKPGEWLPVRLTPGVIHPIHFPKRKRARVLFIPAVCEACQIMREAHNL